MYHEYIHTYMYIDIIIFCVHESEQKVSLKLFKICVYVIPSEVSLHLRTIHCLHILSQLSYLPYAP